VLDEPNANLDDAGEAALVKTVRALKAAGSTVFMVVHQPQMLAAADRVLVLEAGRISRLAVIRTTQTPVPTAAGGAAD
jgi:ABC-type protease/lipase transport system fused ATPase/permease subunit